MSADTRRLRVGLLTHVWAQTLLIAALLAVLNHLAAALFVRADLTSDHRFTLSAPARAAAARLERPLVARMYFTEGLEAPYNNHLQGTRELLEELRAYSGGRMQVEWIDPTGDPAKTEEAERFGIQPIPYRFRSRDRMEMKNVFLGVSLVYGERQLAVNPVANLETLEYELVSAIRQLEAGSEDRRQLGFVTSDGEPNLAAFPEDNPIGQLREALKKRYDLIPLALGGDTGVPDEIDAVLMIGPQTAVPERTQWQLDQFVMRGGGLGMFISQFKGDFQTMRLQEIRHDLNAFFGRYGLIVGKEILVDRRYNETMRLPTMVNGKRQLVPVNHPMLPVTTDLSHDSPITRALDRATIPFVTSLTPADPMPAGAEATTLMHTMVTATAAPAVRTVLPDQFGATPLSSERPGPFPVAVAITGHLPSAFANRPIPKPPAQKDGSVATDDPKDRIDETGKARMVVVATADFVANNPAFIQNTVDWLVADDDLVAIRSRAAQARPLDITPGTGWRWKLAMLLPPALVLAAAAGLVALAQRRAR